MVIQVDVWIETVVCSARKGRSSRLQRLLESRQAFKRRKKGCLGAWLAPAAGQAGMFLVQSVYADEESWRRISDEITEELDSRDGGLESELIGPPLVGMFVVPFEDLALK